MKRFVLLFLVCFSISLSYADVVKWRTSSMAYRYVDEYTEEWGEWSDWEDCNVLVVINEDKDRITIYSNETQEYDIINQSGEDEDYESSSVYFECVDAEGIICTMRIRVFDNSEEGAQLYISYKDIAWVYTIFYE